MFSAATQRFVCLTFITFSTISCAKLTSLFDDDVIVENSLPTQSAIPARKSKALTGSQFMKQIDKLTGTAREEAILREIRNGNIPEFLKVLAPIKVSMQRDGKSVVGTVWVMPDYLAVGSDADYVLIPMEPITAQRIADHFGFLLPTKKLVDTIYEQADLKLDPTPLSPGAAMITSSYYMKHNEMIKEQMRSRPRQGLVAGHKKDLVLTNLLARRRGRVAIYGWHRTTGRAIQPLSLAHHHHYADYSHGVRLVSNTMLVDGEERPVEEVLESPYYAALLSDEGPLRQIRIATECP